MRARLLVFSLVLLTLPWMGWRYLQEMQGFLLTGHQQAQLLTARALATVAEGFPQAFSRGDSGDPALLRYARPLAEFPLLDGYFGDWRPLTDGLFDVAGHDFDVAGHDADAEAQWFRWLVGTWEDSLYLLLRVSDRQRVYRHPGYPRLDTSDHLRLRLVDDQGMSRRLTVNSDGPGEATVQEVGRDWRYPLHGAPKLPIRAFWQEVEGGYQIELRMPLDWGRSLALAVVDVDDAQQRIVERMQWSPRRPPGGEPIAWRLLARSPTLQARLRRDWQVDGVVTVVDRDGWVRAASEGAGDAQRLPSGLDARVFEQVLGSDPVSWIEVQPYSNGSDHSMAAWPVRAVGDDKPGEVIGAVLVSEAVADLSAAQWQSFIGITLATGAVLLVLIVGLLLFAARIAWRIRRLGRQTADAIDEQGRVQRAYIRAEAHAGDEFGGLSRRISAMLQRLQRFTGFLESIPRTLRHEINNPLNTISTSLQNLVDTRPELADDRYQQAAARGVQRLERIVNSLTEAAGLEQSLHGDPVGRFDLAALLQVYADSAGLANPGYHISCEGPGRGIVINGSDFRIEQLLDKLVDNALDFTAAGGRIVLSLQRGGRGDCWLRVSNDGPPLPDAIRGQLFDSMVSARDRVEAGRPHLGMGLFIVRAIAEYHGGELHADNRADGGGAVMAVRLPLA